MNAASHPNPEAPAVDFWTRHGELNLEGRLLIHCDQQFAAGNHGAALDDLLTLLARAPWLQALCAERTAQLLNWRYGQVRPTERHLLAPSEEDAAADDEASPDLHILLDRVLSQPSGAVVIHRATQALLLEGLLHQAVWDAAVWLDPEAIPNGSPPAAASWLDGLATAMDRRPAPLRQLRLRGADRYLRQQGLTWLPRRQPLSACDKDKPEASEPADWPHCLRRSLERQLEHARQLRNPEQTRPPAETPNLSLVLTINCDDSAEAISRSLTSLAEAWPDAGDHEEPGVTELLVVHPPLRPGQRIALEHTMVQLALRNLQLLEVPKRVGLALACNRALAASRGSQLLVMRAGVSLNSSVLPALQQALSDPCCRAVQPVLLSGNRCIVGMGYGFAQPGQPGQPLLHGLTVSSRLAAQAPALQAVQGSCYLLRRQELLAIGGWDVQFADGLEDQDLCLRLIQRFGGHCLVCTAVSADAPIEHGLEACHAERDWNRAVFVERWRHGVEADLAEHASALGYTLVGLLPESHPPKAAGLQRPVGVLAPHPDGIAASAS